MREPGAETPSGPPDPRGCRRTAAALKSEIDMAEAGLTPAPARQVRGICQRVKEEVRAMTKRVLIAGSTAGSLAILIACAALTSWRPEAEGELPSVSAALGVLGPAQPRTYYQYVDEGGAVRFALSLDQVPEAWRGHAGQVVLDVPPPDSPAASRMMRKLRPARDAAVSAR